MPGGRIPPAVRDVEIAKLQDAFLIAAIGMILVIRLQLWATNYPQLGGGGLHIAHLLWGGLFMVIAIGMLLSFLGRGFRLPAAVVAGVGFGFFIDELGKFVTEDNDYFFKPAAGIIYLIFVALFLLTRWMQSSRGFSQREYLVNAVDALTDAARRDLDADARQRALELLARADPADPLTEPVRRLLEEIDPLPAREPGRVGRLVARVRNGYIAAVERPWFERLVAIVFGLWALVSLVAIATLALALALEFGGAGGVIDVGQSEGDHVSFINLASFASSLLAGVLVIVGIWRLRSRGRLPAYAMFERALLVEIFIGQFFAFVESQFAAVFGLIANVLLLITLRLMIGVERRAQGPPAAASQGERLLGQSAGAGH
jgi:hypothetical protein